MCGIAGIFSQNKNDVSIPRLKAMTDAIAHRGPDGEGQWISEDGLCGLANRRLAIIDISVSGKQPMHYLDRYIITYNGEIYNYLELRSQCIKQGYQFQSNTDTEVLLALYDWKKESCLQELDGMFAFAIYDSIEKKLFIARDRMGEKPFYYVYQPGKFFAFASEMKALWAVGYKREINDAMLYNFMAFNYTQNPEDPGQTFFKEIHVLPAAHYGILQSQTIELTSKKYWDFSYEEVDESISLQVATEQFRELFFRSVSRRLRSDVPVGSSLSGGLDSSIVVAVINELNKNNNQRQSVFSAVFPGYLKDESNYIELLLDKIKLDPHYVSPSAETLLNDIDKCFYYQEEPFGSASVLTQYEVMKLAANKSVTVLLDGQGADELMAGYHSYYPVFFRELKRKSKTLFRHEKLRYKSMYRNSAINPLPEKNIRYYAGQLGWIEKDSLKRKYEQFMQWINPYFNREFFEAHSEQQFKGPPVTHTLNEALYNSMHFGLGELLRFADRNSMGHGRELRLPYLSHELIEFLFRLPASFKIHDGWTKYIARKTFEPLLPQAITWRKDKIGYEPPQKEWLQHDRIKERIMETRKKLVEEKILHRDTLNDPVMANDANLGTKTSWNQLMLSCLFTVD